MPGSTRSTTRLRQPPMSIRLAATGKSDNHTSFGNTSYDDLHGSLPATQASLSTHQVALPLRTPGARGPVQTHSYEPNFSHGDTNDLLRRKTPGGTLNAAYNGTFVEPDMKPPASKHLLLPQAISGQEGQCFRGVDGPKLSTQANDYSSATRSNTHAWTRDSTRNRISSHDVPFDLALWNTSNQHGPMDWQYTPNARPQIMQPPYQPPLGPTASHAFLANNPHYNDTATFPRHPGGNQHAAPQAWIPYQQNAHTELPHYPDTACDAQTPFDSLHHPVNLSQFFAPTTHQTIPLYSPWTPLNAHSYHSGTTTQYGQLSSFPSMISPPTTPYWESSQSPDRILSRAFGMYRDLLSALQQVRSFMDRQKITTPASNGNLSQPVSLDRTSQAVGNCMNAQRPRTNKCDKLNHSAAVSLPSEDESTGATEPPHGSCNSGVGDTNTSSTAGYARQNFRQPIFNAENEPIWGQFSKRQWASTHELRYAAQDALRSLNAVCEASDGSWVQGMLLNGCLSYILGEYENAVRWYGRMLKFDSSNVEATSNLAATYLAQNCRKEAEHYWRQAVKLRPTYFEAIEQLVQLLCFDRRQKEAVQVINHIQSILTSWPSHAQGSANTQQYLNGNAIQVRPIARYTCLPSDNGRLMALIHAKANMLYNMHDQLGAAEAFEEVILVAVGQHEGGVDSLVKSVLAALSVFVPLQSGHPASQTEDNLLLPPEYAIQTAKLCFPYTGDLPGLKSVEHPLARKAAVSLTSNSLLSLAKISQDGMNPNISPAPALRSQHGVREILAMYYLSLSLQPSPSTANNVGILLASVQQPNSSKGLMKAQPLTDSFTFPGVVPGSGIALALTYYRYGLNLDSKHAHLFTNLGSLLKDIGQLPLAVQMYEKAVECDSRFDIALANLANAVKDQGKVGDAIKYYQKAVDVNPSFAEAACGLANSLNSVCDWRGRGGMMMKDGTVDRWHVDQNNVLCDAKTSFKSMNGWIKRVIDIVETQLEEAQSWGKGVLKNEYVDKLCETLSHSMSTSFSSLGLQRKSELSNFITSWKGKNWEGAKIVWLVERATRRILWKWYQDRHVHCINKPATAYPRPRLPETLSVPGAPTILPFHTFTLPVDAKQVRLISQRNGLRVSCSTLRSSWLSPNLYVPPKPPAPQIKVGYVSSDFNNHPLAHLMQSVFGMHDRTRIKAYCYATTPSDNSVHRQQIEREAPRFHDTSSWSTERLVNQIVCDGIHILVNLNGYTRGARNEIFAARPAPIQMSFMGFAGSLGAEWCDYLLADETAIPPKALRLSRDNVDLEDLKEGDSTSGNDDWVHAENVIYTRDTFFCCDHRQSGSDASARTLTWPEEQRRRWAMRKELFPNLPNDAIIFGNFNQLYKIDPTTFRTWLRILSRVPRAHLWLLRFPADGAMHLLSTARAWAGAEVTSRIIFTDVAPKAIHIARGCVADLFLDTPECNAHTTAADCLWSGTPLLTLPRYEWKMCSRMAAGILGGALDRDTDAGREAWEELVASSEEEYEDTAVRLGNGLAYEKAVGGLGAEGRLMELRKMIWEGRWTCKLFDTGRWVRDLEIAYAEAWRRWVAGEGGDIWLKDL